MSAPAPGKTTPVGGYHIARPQGVCALTGQRIEPGEAFMTALRETPQGFERLDIRLDAWEGFDTSTLLGYWQTIMPRPEEKKRLFVDDEVLGDLFQRLADATEPSRINFRFVLGLILMRKRLLTYESTRTDADQEVWIVRRRGSDQPMELLNPHLDEQQVAEVSRQLSEILNEEL